MNTSHDEVVAILSRTPAVLDGMLRRLPEALLTTRARPDTFSPLDVLGHLISGEKTDWVPRIKLILKSGTAEPFAPFDRFGFREAILGRAADELLAEFASLRASNLAFLKDLSLTTEQRSLQGLHPDFGPVTLGQLLTTWAVHDLNHISQVARVVSGRYAEAVGPWKAYLGILNT
jgi:hypothetical protein